MLTKISLFRIAYVLRFLHRLLKKVNEDLRQRLENRIPELRHTSTEPYITAKENDMALRVLVRNHQMIYFLTDKLKSLKQLNVQNDENGILRCQGRIGKAEVTFDTKYPMLIATKTELARAIANEAHLP